MDKLIQWIKDILDSQASPSFGRVGTAITVLCLLCWGSYIVYGTKLIPDVPYGWITIVGLLLGIEIGKEAYIKGKEIINDSNKSS